MDTDQGQPKGALLVQRILIGSGVLFLLVGAFVALFANVVVGIVIAIAGVLDLVMSVLIAKGTIKFSGS